MCQSLMLKIIPVILCVPLSHAQYLFPTEALYLQYGQLMNMKKNFLPLDGVGYKSNGPVVEPKISHEEALSDMYMAYTPDEILDTFKSHHTGGRDADLINQLNLKVYNLTKSTRKNIDTSSFAYYADQPIRSKRLTRDLKSNATDSRKRFELDWAYYVEPRQRDAWDFDRTDPFERNQTYFPYNMSRAETRKKFRLENIGLTYLLHCRYLVDGAMKQRASIITDRRYKIGYLFNRLRRIKTEMLKMVRVAYESNKITFYQRIMVQMRLYEEIIQMDIDVRDTIWEIKDIYDQKQPYDYEDATSTDEIVVTGFLGKSGPKEKSAADLQINVQ